VKNDAAANKLGLATEAPENEALRAVINDYMSRTGMSIPQFARCLGYSGVTLQHFMLNQYHHVGRTANRLTAAIQTYIDLHPIAPPTRVHGELYETANIRTIRETFQRLLPKPVAYMIYAPPGSQKTFGLEHEIARLNIEELSKNGHGRRAYYVYARQGVRPRDMMRRICIACGSATHSGIDTMLENLRRDFDGRRVLLVVDEGQHLSHDCLEVLRELLDQRPHFSLLLAGSHHLPAIFDEFSQRFEQWNSRIIAKVRLPGLLREEARGIVRREIGDILAGRDLASQRKLTDTLIDSATVTDAYADNSTYINVRTLTNSLDQIKAQAAESISKEAIA